MTPREFLQKLLKLQAGASAGPEIQLNIPDLTKVFLVKLCYSQFSCLGHLMQLRCPGFSSSFSLFCHPCPSIHQSLNNHVTYTSVPLMDLSVSLLQSWDSFFRNIQASGPSGEADERRPSALLQGRVLSHSLDVAEKVVEDHLAVHTLIRAYQVGHTHLAHL